MASTRSSSNLHTVVSGLHLIFTIASVAFLSFKVYHLECELSLIRGKVPLSEGDIKVTEATPLSADSNNEELRSERNRRDDQQKLKSYTGDSLKAACVQKLLGDLQVSNCFPLIYSIFFYNYWAIELPVSVRTYLGSASVLRVCECAYVITTPGTHKL